MLKKSDVHSWTAEKDLKKNNNKKTASCRKNIRLIYNEMTMSSYLTRLPSASTPISARRSRLAGRNDYLSVTRAVSLTRCCCLALAVFSLLPPNVFS